MMRIVLTTVITTLSVFGSRTMSAQSHADRTALVIGIGAYEGNTLPNAGPDSADMAVALNALGFEVIYSRESDKTALSAALTEFANRLKTGGVGLVYFAGHAIQ